LENEIITGSKFLQIAALSDDCEETVAVRFAYGSKNEIDVDIYVDTRNPIVRTPYKKLEMQMGWCTLLEQYSSRSVWSLLGSNSIPPSTSRLRGRGRFWWHGQRRLP
jgi:hypothetical protein